MHPSSLLQSSPLSLSDRLRRRTKELRCKIIRANWKTKFAQAASELDGLRRATADLADRMDDDTLSDAFRKTVQFTTHDTYAPFISRFFEKPCKASDIVDLLAPGLPDYLAVSSSTSGGLSKIFPKYNRLPRMKSSDAVLQSISEPLRRTTANVWYMWCDRMDIEPSSECPVANVYLACGSVVDRRTELHLDPQGDREWMGAFILDQAAPYAAGFIRKWRSFLLIHALFAMNSRFLETVSTLFINTFADLMRHIDVEFDMLVDCIANGTIPDLNGIEDVRRYLESNILPDPERAAELRKLGRPSSLPGWCSHAWPNLHSIIGAAGGAFSSSVPLARSYLGPNTEINPRGYGSTEGWIGSSYNPADLNQFKPGSENLIEFLDVSKDGDISAVAQTWEVEVGRRYEVVLTTPDGLWRYRLDDVVEIAGFDPTDGTPIMRFIERRSVVLRLPDFMVTENELRAAMSFMPQNTLVNVVDWTATIDDRRVPDTIGFFMELADEQVFDHALASGVPDHVLNELSRMNENIPWSLEHERFRRPTIRLVRPGTFSEFRQLKLDEGSNSLGQIKVPVVLPNKASYVTWFSGRVVREL